MQVCCTQVDWVWKFCLPLTPLSFHSLIYKMGIIMILSTSHWCWGIKGGTAHKSLSRCLVHKRGLTYINQFLVLILLFLCVYLTSLYSYFKTQTSSLKKYSLTCFPTIPPYPRSSRITWGYFYFSSYFITPSSVSLQKTEHLKVRSCARFVFDSTEPASCHCWLSVHVSFSWRLWNDSV